MKKDIRLLNKLRRGCRIEFRFDGSISVNFIDILLSKEEYNLLLDWTNSRKKITIQKINYNGNMFEHIDVRISSIIGYEARATFGNEISEAQLLQIHCYLLGYYKKED